MSSSRWARARKRGLAAVAGVGMVAATLSTAGAATAAPPSDSPAAEKPSVEAPAPTYEDGRYVVVMKAEPVAAYDGGVAGYAETKPGKGKKYNPRSAAATKYRDYLKAQQREAQEAVGVDEVSYEYTEALSGFTADLTAEQATALAKDERVLAVTRDEMRQLDTVASPDFLGLTGKKGVWARLGGLDQPDGAGAGVVVGIVDSGIWPENPSFAGEGFTAPEDWAGACESQDDPLNADEFCNDKLIGARYFVDGFGEANLADYEYLSPRDADGHGTHTASTAAGNNGVSAVIEGREFGEVSGMAPEAHIAAYKVCWDGKTGSGCYNSDSAAAIDQAVADGVDVINFSISGTSSNFLDPVEFAFLFAAEAGVFVAASSGNDGPTTSTTNHPSPWLTTVAASTHAIREQTLVTGDGSRYIGASITDPLETSTPMVLAEDIPAEDATSDDAALCFPGTLDPTAAADKIVVCDRGVSARVEKSAVVADAGGVGMVLVNVTEGSLDTDLHSVPTVHLSHEYRDALRAYVRGAESPTGQILPTNEGTTTQVPEVAGFSSRGPTYGADGDILKPDISAPGVGVLAAYSPRSAERDFDFLSGTSMSSPHIAGLAALVKDAHPDWSPMAIKSAMMTTARDHASEASNDLFAAGAGFVEPRRFLDPGLVYDSGFWDWWNFLAGQGVTYNDGTPISETPIDASDLNQASIAIGSLAGTQTVTRTVTNVTGKTKVWHADVSGLEGIDVRVSPSRLVVRPGQSASFTVTFTSTSSTTYDKYAQGHLTWRDNNGSKGTTVRSPIAVRPVVVAAPGEVHASAGAESFEVEVTPGFSGTMTTSVAGLVPAKVTDAVMTNTGQGDFDPGDTRNHTQPLVVDAGTELVRIELVPDNAADDLDLFITRNSDGALVAYSASGTAAERITAELPAGAYTVHVQAWAVEGGGPSTGADVREFQVTESDAGNLTVVPAEQEVTVAEPVTFTGELDVEPDTAYLGWIEFGNGSADGVRTLVSVG